MQAILGPMESTREAMELSFGAWGFEGESYPPSAQLLQWLEKRLGCGEPVPRSDPASIALPEAHRLPALPVPPSVSDLDRIFHARGQGLPDILRLRSGVRIRPPDAVCRPREAAQVEAVLQTCQRDGTTVIPWGGGTSVTGGVNVPQVSGPVLSLDLGELAGLVHLDERSRLATFLAGTRGPAVEAALAEHGFTLGHFPQSWELSTVGGWVVTRSSGQESLGYGRIEDMVAGLQLVAPAGRLDLAPLPGSAAGPELRTFVAGSEGRLGIVTSVTLRVEPRPERKVVQAAFVRSWDEGLDLVRELVQTRVPLSMIRLSDPAETRVALAIGLASSRFSPLVERYLRARKIGDGSCLLLYGAAGGPELVRSVLSVARSVCRRHHGVIAGTGPGRHWLADRFRHPYMRDSLLDSGYATDTFETATPWSGVDELRTAVSAAVEGALDPWGEATALLCHVSHPYRDGTSLYFTFFYRTSGDCDENIARWAAVKRAAMAAIVGTGGTISHHHGVGSWHAPWLEAEVGSSGRAIMKEASRTMDPGGILNPQVLLDPTDRLES